VTIADLADTAPAITGPSNGPGAAASAITVNEGTTTVTTLTSNVPVTWSIVGGDDQGRFSVDSSGAITFTAETDYENPVDSDRNNTYVLLVEARDGNGNLATQTVTVFIRNVDELARRLDEIGENLRGNLRNHAFSSLSTMLQYNEGLLNVDESFCFDPRRSFSGQANSDDYIQAAGVNFRKDLTSCKSRTRTFVDTGVGFTRVNGNWTTRGLAAAGIEQKLDKRVVIGAALLGTTSADKLSSFDDSRISDKSLQLNVYGRAHLADQLRFGAFAGWGKAWYSFRLNDDGLALRGRMTGYRHIYGAVLSGDIQLAGTTITTDATLSRASEQLNSAKLNAYYKGEEGSKVLFLVGKVDVTRLSVPVQIPIIFGHVDRAEPTRLDISPGLLCQDTEQDSSSIDCGYQLGFKFRLAPSFRWRIQAQARREVVEGYASNLLSVGVMRHLGKRNEYALGLDAEREARAQQADNRLMMRFGVSR
jgi:hypothetical protein